AFSLCFTLSLHDALPIWLLGMDRDQCLWLHHFDSLSQLGGHHMSRAVNLVSRESEMIEPVHEPLLINLHLLSEGLAATVDESSRSEEHTSELQSPDPVVW